MTPFFLIILTLFCYTTFKIVQLMPSAPFVMIFNALLFFAIMLGPMFLSRTKPKIIEAKWFLTLNWVGSIFMGWMGTFVLISIPVDLIQILFALFSDKIYFTQTIHLLIFALSAIATILGFIEVLRGPKIVEVDIPLPNLPESLQNFKIAQISDLHVGPTIQTRYVTKVVEKTNSMNPDVVVITGDLVDAHTESVKRHLLPLANLKSKHGTFYVTGNHEYYWGIQALIPELQKIGITVLLNSNKILEVNGSKILLAGITDPMGNQLGGVHKPNLRKSREVTSLTDVNILLAHRPDPYRDADEMGFHIQFSGHTHAGQFFPFSLLIPIAHKYYRGLNRFKNLWLYVNPGTGYWGPANRFGIASEITLAKLTKS